MRYAIRQDRKVRKPLPGCQLTETEWLACWDTLNKGIESQDDETIQKSKMLVRSAIKKIYTERYPKSKKCVVCGETCGTSGLCRKCWRALSNNAVLRSEGHTQKDRVANQQGPCIVCGRTPVLCRKVCNRCYAKIDMFDTRAHANANAVILGSSGYGKTFTAQLFALRLSEMDTQVFIISPLKGLEDYGGGCKAVNGQFVSMDPSSDNNINIMDIRAPDDEDAKLLDDYEASGSFLTKKIHTILSFLHLVVRNMTQEEEQLIDGCLYATYAKFGITRDNNSIYDKDGNYKVMPLLEDLQEEMRKKPELHTVCNILNPLINGSMACFNHHTNVDLDSKYIVFDFNGMKGSLLTMSMFVVLDFVWTKIKEDRTQRKAVFIDECWKLIGTDSNEQAAEDVVEIFRTIRAYGGSAFAMTQDISQFYEYKGGKYGKAIIGNADTKIIMHLIPSEAKALQEAIQLTSVEMEAVSSLPRGQGLVCSASAKLFVDFVADDYEAKEITTDAKSFYERRKALEKKKREEEEKAAENTVIDVEM